MYNNFWERLYPTNTLFLLNEWSHCLCGLHHGFVELKPPSWSSFWGYAMHVHDYLRECNVEMYHPQWNKHIGQAGFLMLDAPLRSTTVPPQERTYTRFRPRLSVARPLAQGGGPTSSFLAAPSSARCALVLQSVHVAHRIRLWRAHWIWIWQQFWADFGPFWETLQMIADDHSVLSCWATWVDPSFNELRSRKPCVCKRKIKTIVFKGLRLTSEPTRRQEEGEEEKQGAGWRGEGRQNGVPAGCFWLSWIFFAFALSLSLSVCLSLSLSVFPVCYFVCLLF